MAHMAICIPVSLVAAAVALAYGKSIGRAWPSALITFAVTLLSGFFYKGVGQIFGVILSALIIFLVFARPEHKRIAQEEAAKDKEFNHLPNEEDM